MGDNLRSADGALPHTFLPTGVLTGRTAPKPIELVSEAVVSHSLRYFAYKRSWAASRDDVPAPHEYVLVSQAGSGK